MGCMLDALRQIELRKPQSPVPARQDAAGVVETELAYGSWHPAVTTDAEKQSAACEDSVTIRDVPAMESLLVEAERAATELLGEVAAEPPKPRAESDAEVCPTCEDCEEREASRSERAGRAEEVEPTGSLDSVAKSVLHAMTPWQAACFLFASPDSDTLGADLLVPLSMALARRLDSKLLLIDTNLRRPALAARLGVEASRGLTDVLSGAARWQDVVRRTVLPGVDLLPAVPFSTPAGPAPDRLNLDRLLAEAREHYRLVLVRASSLRHPEVVPMARRCEGVYLVVRLHSTTRRAAAEAVPLLRRGGANVLGCVVVQ